MATNTFYGYINLEHKYNVAWNEMNRQQYIGEFAILNTGKRVWSEMGDEYERVVTIKAPHGVDINTINKVASNEFSYGCRCEHDCCGHVQTYARNVVHIKKREYAVRVVGYLNI